MRLLSLLLLVLSLPAPAHASELWVLVTTPGGKPVANAVVTVRPQAGLPRTPIRFSWAYRMAQQDMTFDPFVLIVPAGAEVAFPNLDPVRHHVYSFSPAKTFELKLYGRDETRKVRFDKPGNVAVGCNIHDDMSGFIRVVDTPYAAKTGANGQAVIRDLPAGAATLTLWHPYARARGGETVQQVTAPADGQFRLTLSADLRSPPMRHGY
ncbi:MAG: methylamine utilization protein [Phenylobacterium sp.]